MCDRIPRDYSLRIGDQYAYVTSDGQWQVSAVISEVWDIFPMPDNLRSSNEREAVIGNNYELRPYNATVDGRLWTEGNSPNGSRIKIYFRDFNREGLPNSSNRITIPYFGNSVRDIAMVANVEMFGLAYQDRMFLCMLTVCSAEEEINGNGLPTIRCRDFFVNQVDNSTHDQIAINKFCDREDPNSICLQLCPKTRETSEQCQSILYTRCSNPDYARDNPSICGCHLPVQVYRDYINRLRANINNLDNRYSAIKSILQLVDYDPTNPQCFYPACITAQYKGIYDNMTICPDFTVCFQGIDLSADVINDVQLNLLNECLINRNINGSNPPVPGPGPTPAPQPRPPVPRNNGKSKNSTITWVAIGGGIVLLIVVIAIAVSVGKKGGKK